MSKKFLTNIDLQKNQLENAVVHKSSTAPSSPSAGQLWYDDGNHELKYYDGTQWVSPSTTEGHTYALSGSGATVQLTQDAGTIGNAGTYQIPAASGSAAGTMSAAHYTKLEGIAAGATANTGTVTSVAAGTGLTGGTITSSGTIAHSTANGYKHIPSTDSNTSASAYIGRGSNAGEGAWVAPDTTPTADSTKLITSGAVASAISGLPTPMQFKGTLGTNGTFQWSGGSNNLPAAAASNVGWTIKVITQGSGQGVSAKAGDTIVSRNVSGSTYEWTLIPSGDEPSGTVTNIATSGAITGGPITSTGTISHSTANGYKHIPQDGASGNALRWSAAGTAAWESVDTAPTASSSALVTSGGVYTAIQNIAHPEQISRATFTIASGYSTGNVDIGAGRTVFAVTAIQSNAGVVADWTYSGKYVTVTLAANATAAVTVNVLYYGGGSAATANQMDFIVDQGSANGWTWRKYNSGVAECWGNVSHSSVAVSTKTGNAWYSGELYDSFPSGLFNAAPTFCGISLNNGSNAAAVEIGPGLSSTRTQSYWLMRVESAATVSTWVQYHALGTWK